MSLNLPRLGIEPACALALAGSFGDLEGWADEVESLAARHVDDGYLSLVFDPAWGVLRNTWHPGPAPAEPRLVVLWSLDLRQPAQAAALSWPEVYQRYRDAVHDASEGLGCSAEALEGATVLDVRRAGVFEKATTMLPGADWRDPANVAQWAAEVTPGDPQRPVVVYCIYGHEVGRSTALKLRAQGLNARFLAGGIDAWQAAGRPLVPKG